MTHRRGGSITRRVAIIAGCALAVAPPALAHRSQTVLSTVMWNAGSSMLEVTHRVHNADAEAWLAQLGQGSGASAIDITVVRNQAQMMLYVEQHFGLTEGGKKIALQALGAEVEGEALLLYQQCKLAAAPTGLAIDNRILRDVFDGQTNLVNVRLAQRTRTLIFSGQDGVKKAEGLL
ncbi:MAG: hypothetical protein Q8R82_19835 [Hyphomonadaceae bacterium]|nr:hypothetical protein [Hyphomonadaceae bacterium]